jgi:ATP-dependent DNA ligase
MLNTKLYKLDSKGKKREWTIDVIDNGDFSEIVINAGLVDGKLVETRIPVLVGKNTGKANATTHYSQALAEALAKFELQERSGYVQDINEVKQAVLRSGISCPMLAQKFHSTLAQKGSKNLEKLKLEGERVYIQAKIDGNRCLAKITKNGVNLYTRKGDLMLRIPHIEEQLIESFSNFDEDEIILDGELYSDEISFNTLNGLLRKEDKTNDDLAQLKSIDYIIYDTYSEQGYENRFETIKQFQSESVLLIPNYEIIASNDAIQAKLEDFLEKGYEGAMLRVLGKPYDHKRSWNLCKIKEFSDDEYLVLDVETDVMGRLGKFVMEMKTPTMDRDGKLITTFKAGVTGMSHEEGYEILKNKANYIGKMATIEFFTLSEYFVPRFPKFKSLRLD